MTGLIDLADLRRKLSARTAAVYVENPSYLGFIERQGAEISELAHEPGAESVVGVDAISLGVLAPPAPYGADIVGGEIQPLGVHMPDGGGVVGFIATRHEERFLAEHPSMLIGITSTVASESAFFYSLWERTSYMIKEADMSAAGTSDGCDHRGVGRRTSPARRALWGIIAGVYLALIGPQGLHEIGETIMQRSEYATKRMSAIDGVKRAFGSIGFKEFVANFEEPGLSVEEINKALLAQGIFGGKDISREFPELGQSALYCVTEVHRKEDIDALARRSRRC